MAPLYPGPSTFPGASTFPGPIDDNPQFEVLYSTDDASEPTPAWTYVANGDFRGYQVDRGRGTELDTVDAGTATITLSNRARSYDPFQSSSFVPMNQWWVRAKYAGATEDRFKGYADRYSLTWPEKGKDSVTVVSCSDELKILNLARTPAFDPADVADYTGVVGADKPSHVWRWADRFLTTTTIVTETFETSHFEWGPGNPYGGFVFDTKTTATVEGPGWRSTGSGYGQSSDTPILGYDVLSSGLFGCLLMDFVGTANQLTSTDASAGDMQQSDKGTVEFWFKKTANPGGTGTLWFSPEVEGVAARLWGFQLLTTGAVRWATRVSGAVTLNSDTAVLNNDTWYHIVGVRDGTNQILYVNGVAQATNASTAAWEQSSSTNLMIINNPASGVTVSFAEMAVYPGVGLSASRVLAHYQAGTARGFVHDEPGYRAGAVLDSVASQAPRLIQSGSRDIVDMFMAGQPALSHLRLASVCEAPAGMLFVSKSGVVTFLAANFHTVDPWATSSMTFDDDGTDSPYWDTSMDMSDAFLGNIWNVTAAFPGAATQTVSDAASVSRYLQREQTMSGLPLRFDAHALTIAQAYLAAYKDPMARLPQVVPDMADPATVTAVLRRDLGDQVTVLRKPLGGGVISQAAWIQSIQETGAPGVPLRVEFGVSPR